MCGETYDTKTPSPELLRFSSLGGSNSGSDAASVSESSVPDLICRAPSCPYRKSWRTCGCREVSRICSSTSDPNLPIRVRRAAPAVKRPGCHRAREFNPATSCLWAVTPCSRLTAFSRAARPAASASPYRARFHPWTCRWWTRTRPSAAARRARVLRASGRPRGGRSAASWHLPPTPSSAGLYRPCAAYISHTSYFPAGPTSR
jgi:hypothetical protein